MTLTHARCGGVLAPEEHRHWSLTRSGLNGTNRGQRPFLADTLETLHRCDRCGHIGVATKTGKNPAP